MNQLAVAVKKSVKPVSYWLKKNWYYHEQVSRFYTWCIPAGCKVLQIGAQGPQLLARVRPSHGIGITADAECLREASAEFPHLSFFSSLHQLPAGMTFDVIILSAVIMETEDVQQLLTDLQAFCTPHTRVILDNYSFWWEPILRMAQKIGLRRPTELQNWLTPWDLNNFLSLAGFEVVGSGRRMLVPLHIPLVSSFLNSFVSFIPFINRLCLLEWTVARPLSKENERCSVSVIIPCRNERGNIERMVKEFPSLGRSTELIFVEGHSVDGTLEEIQRVARQYPEKNISVLVQSGAGKGDAVRLGFEHAQGDILMIFDGDNTIPMHELARFVEILQSGKAEFANGSRFVYGMEAGATRFLNIIANYAFGLGFSWLLGQRIKDTLCGTKVLFKKDYERIAAQRDYFGDFDPFGDFDLLFGAAKLQLKIVDIPIHYKARTYGSTQIRRFYHGYLLAKMWIFALRKFKF